MARFPGKPETQRLTSQADHLYRAGQRAEAIRLYNEALRLEPDCVYVLVQCGMALQENGSLDQAVRRYDRAIDLDPQYAPAYYGRAWAKGWKKDFKGELQDAQKGYQLDPNHPGMYLRRIGAALTGMKRFQEAINAYTKAIESNPSDEGTLLNRAICYRQMKQYDLALRDLDRALQLDPDWDWAFAQKGLVYEEIGQPKEALVNYDKALFYNPRYGPALEGRQRVQGGARSTVRTKAGAGRSAQGSGCVDVVMFVLLCLIVAPLLLYLGISTIYDDNQLSDHGRTVNAFITNSRSEYQNGRTLYEVQFKYSVDGGYTWYTSSDNTGRVNLWCSLPEAEWRSALASGQTAVLYLPERPWVSRLAYSTPLFHTFDNLVAVGMGISIWVLFLLLSLSRHQKGTSH